MAKRKIPKISVEDFKGIHADMAALDLPTANAAVDINGSRYNWGSWRPRAGMADTDVADGSTDVILLGSFLSTMGQRWTVKLDDAGAMTAVAEVATVWDEGDV